MERERGNARSPPSIPASFWQVCVCKCVEKEKEKREIEIENGMRVVKGKEREERKEGEREKGRRERARESADSLRRRDCGTRVFFQPPQYPGSSG